MEESRKDPLQRVRIRPASQFGLEDEPNSSHEPVDNDGEILKELLRVSRLLTQIAESIARLEVMIDTSLPSQENVWGIKQDKARQLLVDLLTDNPDGVDVKRIRFEAAIRGISMRTMREVKQSIGLESKKRGTSWLWKWPDR